MPIGTSKDLVGSPLENTNSLLNLISHKLYTDKIYWYTKDAYEGKHKFLIEKHKDAVGKHCNDSKAFIGNSKKINDMYENIEECSSSKEHKLLIVFDYMITDMLIKKT